LPGDTGRRKDIRINARLKARFKDASAFIYEYTHNISKGGLFVRTQNPCDMGCMVEVVIIIPETEKEIPALGEVIHIVSPGQVNRNKMGRRQEERQPPPTAIQPRSATKLHHILSPICRQPGW